MEISARFNTKIHSRNHIIFHLIESSRNKILHAVPHMINQPRSRCCCWLTESNPRNELDFWLCLCFYIGKSDCKWKKKPPWSTLWNRPCRAGLSRSRMIASNWKFWRVHYVMVSTTTTMISLSLSPRDTPWRKLVDFEWDCQMGWPFAWEVKAQRSLTSLV